MRASMPAQARRMLAVRMTGNRSSTVRALVASCCQSRRVRFSSRRGQPRWPPPISTVPLAHCLSESLRRRVITTGAIKAGSGSVIISIGAITVSGTGSPRPAAIRSAQAPAGLTRRGAGDAGTERLRLALEGLRRAQRVGSAIAPRNHTAGAGAGNRGYQPAQFPGGDQFLMVKAAQSQHVDARAAVRQIGLGLGDQDLAVRTEAAIIVDEFADPVPERHGRVRERNLRDIAGELAHAAGIDARGMAAGMVFLQ